MCLKIKGGREVRSLVHIFNFWRVREKTQGGREVRLFISSNSGECAKKPKEIGRLGWNSDSEVVCLKIKGGREVRSFVGSYLQFLESARKKPRR